MKESIIQSKILKYLNSLGECKAVKYPGGYYSKNGTPDILCCYQGHFIAFEVKTEKGKITKLQQIEIEGWKKSGASALTVRSVDDVKRHFNEGGRSNE
jgi:Holliday junction resolvase